MAGTITQSELVRRIDEFIREQVEGRKVMPSVECVNSEITKDGYMIFTLKVWDKDLAQEMLDCGASLIPVNVLGDNKEPSCSKTSSSLS